jgi:dolichyl-phosphate beta-glucosyltransferase
VDALIDAPEAVGPARALVIPMFNEVGRIERTLETLAGSPLVVGELELVLVDDGSTDGTVEVAGRAATRLGLGVRVLQLGTNQGKGAAVRAGMLAATARSRVFVDSDLSVEVEDLLRCFDLLEGGIDVAYGTRAHRDSSISHTQPPHRVITGRTYNLLLRVLRLTSERDTQCGMKGFSADAAEGVFAPLRTIGFGFDVEALARAERGGWRVAPVPVTWSHVEASRVRAVRDGFNMGLSALRTRRQLSREAASPGVAARRGTR